MSDLPETPRSLARGPRSHARDIAAALYAQTIWRTGDMTTAGDELERKIVQRVYDDHIPAAAAAAWLKISTRWLRKLAGRSPRKPAPLEPHEAALIRALRDRPGQWLTRRQLLSLLDDQGLVACEATVAETLERYVKVGQVVTERRGAQVRYRAAERVRMSHAKDTEARKAAVMTRARAIPETIEQYLGGVPGAAFSIYRYSVPRGREQAIAHEIRTAVGDILRRHTAVVEADAEAALEEGRVPESPGELTYLVLGAQGWLGAPKVEDEL